MIEFMGFFTVNRIQGTCCSTISPVPPRHIERFLKGGHPVSFRLDSCVLLIHHTTACLPGTQAGLRRLKKLRFLLYSLSTRFCGCSCLSQRIPGNRFIQVEHYYCIYNVCIYIYILICFLDPVALGGSMLGWKALHWITLPFWVRKEKYLSKLSGVLRLSELGERHPPQRNFKTSH